MKRKHLCRAIALVLAMVMLVNYAGSVRVEAVEPTQLYVESVRIFTAPTKEEAVSACKKAGFIPADYDLNAGNDADAVVLGYTTTPDKEKAVTDFSVLEMNSGYDIYSYADFQEKEMEKMGAVSAPYMIALGEYRENLAKGSPAAIEARTFLNLYTIPEKEDIGLGDYLADPACSEDFVKKLFCQASTSVLSAMFSNMVEGVADYQPEDGNWAERLTSDTLREELAAAEEDTGLSKQLDSTYKDMAMDLREVMREFSEKFTKAKNYIDTYGEEALLEKMEGLQDSEIGDEVIEEITLNSEFADLATFSIYLSAYNILNQYQYDEETTLAEYLVTLGRQDFSTDKQLRKLYPLSKALTKGQFGILRVVGMASMATSLVNNELIIEKADEMVSKLTQDILDYTGGESDRLSVWEGVDRSVYESDVALTDEAKRSTYAAGDFADLVKQDYFDKALSKIQTAASVGGAMVGIAVFAVTVAVNMATMIGLGLAGFYATYGVFIFNTATIWTLCFNAAMGGSIVGAVCGFLGCVMLAMSAIFAVISVVLLIVMVAKWVYEQFQEEDDTLEYTSDDIPSVLYDYRDGQYVQYLAVTEASTGKPADLNGGDGRRFASLYYSKRSAAEMPIKVNPDGDTFKVLANNNYAPDGYAAVHYIGEGGVANLNTYGRNKGASALYLSYFVQKPTVINPGEEKETPEAGEDVLYLSALTLTVQKTAYAAKTALAKEGYTVIDQNLTNFLGVESQLYSYLGYKTTKLASLAITDIRVMTGGNYPESVNYGAATYSKAGSASAGGAAIYYTRSDMAGTPVYPDLQVVSERSAAKEGFEPVNLFSGGPAYNFNNCDYVGDYGYANLSYKRWNQNGLYIYFHPSVTYTSGTEYLGGMAFFTGCEITARSGDEILEYGEDMGYELFAGCDFTADYAMTVTVTTTDSYNAMSSGAHYIDCDDFTTYLGLTKTYNPYRAIYAVKSYTAMPGASSLQPALYIPGEAKAANEPATGCGYAACGVYCQYIRRLDQDAGTLGNSVRGMSPANSYLGRRNVAPYPGITLDDERTVLQDREEFERFGWMESGVRLKNLFVSGRAEGMSPLEADTLEIFDDPREQKEKNDAGFYCVGDLRVPAESGIHNLAYSDENPVYLAVKCAPEEKKAYISGISVVSWDMKTAVGDDKKYADLDDDEKEAYDREADDVCISQLRAQCRDEILIRNLAVSFKDSKGADPDNTPEQCSYIGVTRTNDETKAIRAIIKFQYSGSGKPNSTITVRGVRYTRAGDSPVHDPKTGDYYLYYTTNNGAAPGEPITSIDFSAVPMIEGAATVLTATEQDVAERTRSGEVIQEGKIAELKSRGGESNYIHAYFNTDKSHICDIYVGVGNTEEAAMIDLMNMGCSILLPVDMNKSSNGKYIFLGYDRNFSESLSDKYAVRDILCTVGHAPQESIEYNGMTYIRARDKYIMSYDPTHAVSLNEGTNGFAIYLYYTLDRTDPSLNPIRNLGVTLKDFVPDNNGALVWENVMTTSGRRCNFNDGVYATEDGHSVDTRIYLYANRDGNVVKAGASVYGGSTMGSENLGGVGMMRFGTLVLE